MHDGADSLRHHRDTIFPERIQEFPLDVTQQLHVEAGNEVESIGLSVLGSLGILTDGGENARDEEEEGDKWYEGKGDKNAAAVQVNAC